MGMRFKGSNPIDGFHENISFFRNKNEKPSIYFYNGGEEQDIRRYYPVNACLQEISKHLLHASDGKRPWVSLKRSLYNLTFILLISFFLLSNLSLPGMLYQRRAPALTSRFFEVNQLKNEDSMCSLSSILGTY